MKTSLSLVRTRNAMYQQEVQRDALARELAELQRKVEVLTARKRKRDQAAKKASPLQQQMFRIAKKIERAKVGVEELDVAIGRREHELRAAQQRTAAAAEARRKGGADDDADGDNGEEAERAAREMERVEGRLQRDTVALNSARERTAQLRRGVDERRRLVRDDEVALAAGARAPRSSSARTKPPFSAGATPTSSTARRRRSWRRCARPPPSSALPSSGSWVSSTRDSTARAPPRAETRPKEEAAAPRRASSGSRTPAAAAAKRKGSGEAKGGGGFNRANERWQQKKKTAMIGARRAEELTYEKGFARIRELTGIDDLGELVAKFLDLEASAFHDWRVSRQHAAEIDEAEAAVAALREEAAQAAAEAQEGRRAMQVRVDALDARAAANRLARARHEKAAAAARDVTRFVGETLGGWACAAPTVALLGAIGLRAHQLELPNVQLNDGDNDDDDDAARRRAAARRRHRRRRR